MDNGFQNSFPVKNNRPEKIGPPEKSKKNLSVLNVGQMLVLAVLLIIMCAQALSILFAPAQSISVEPLPLSPDIIRSQPEAPAVTEPAQAAETPVAEAAVPAEPEILFILGENNGRLAVLSPDGQTVYETFSVYINTLPEYDRNLLLEGIKIKTAEELGSLLEDFSS